VANTIPYQEISLGPNEVPQQPIPRLVYLAQGAAFRRGDIVAKAITGAITTPSASSGALAGKAGPSTSAITITNHAVAGAPATTYFIMCTYEDSGDSSQSNPSSEVVYNCPAGNVPNVSVASAGAPAGADHFNIFVGLFPGGECLQNAAPVLLGGNANLTYPLTNNYGANLCPTNPANNVGILGLADVASNALFTGGYPGQAAAPFPLPAFGASGSVPPLDPPEAIQISLISLANNTLIEINLKNTTPYYPGLDGTTAGLAYDPATGFWYADPAGSHASLHLVTAVNGAYTTNPLTGVPVGSNPGQVGDFGVRMIAYVDSTYLA
jgi:hypothetical protein